MVSYKYTYRCGYRQSSLSSALLFQPTCEVLANFFSFYLQMNPFSQPPSLVQTTVISHLNLCTTVVYLMVSLFHSWHPQSILNTAARVTLLKHRSDQVPPLFKMLQWLPSQSKQQISYKDLQNPAWFVLPFPLSLQHLNVSLALSAAAIPASLLSLKPTGHIFNITALHFFSLIGMLIPQMLTGLLTLFLHVFTHMLPS